MASRLAAMFVGPPRMPPMVWEWLKPKVYGHLLAVIEERLRDRSSLTRPQLVELTLMQRKVKPHAQRKRLLRGTLRQTFVLDLTGWRYLNDFDDPWEVLDEIGEEISVRVNFQDQPGSAGTWDFVGDGDLVGILEIGAFAPLYKTFQVLQGDIVGASSLMQDAMTFLKDTIRHELEHMGQDLLEEMGMQADDLLLGVYEGVPLPERTVWQPPLYPDVIFLFQEHLEEVCDTLEDMEREIEITVVHEVAHFLGMDEERLAELGYA